MSQTQCWETGIASTALAAVSLTVQLLAYRRLKHKRAMAQELQLDHQESRLSRLIR